MGVPNKKAQDYLYNYQINIVGMTPQELGRYVGEVLMGDDWEKLAKTYFGDALSANSIKTSPIPIPGQKNGKMDYARFLSSLIDFTGLVTENVIAIYSSGKERYVTIIPECNLGNKQRHIAIREKLKDLGAFEASSNGLVLIYNARYQDAWGKRYKLDMDINGQVRSGADVKTYHHLFLESGFLDGDEFYTIN